MKTFAEKYFKARWEEVKNCDIEFSGREPTSTSNSLHIYEERYEVNNDEYRLLYSGSSDIPLIEKLIK